MNKTQTSISSNSHRGLFRWMTAGLAALLLSVTSVFAQQTGTVAGQVVDTSTGKYLEGAEVSINDLRTSTERDGKFTLRNVPEGAQKLLVNYPGLDSSETEVIVKAGESVQAEIKLAAQEVITLGEFKVEGTKEGMSQAIALQKVAIQGKLVTAGDQFGAISEGNVGEYLKYLPGVGVDYNVNDARGVSLRGLKTSFTIVAVDGTPMASASSGAANRRFELEQVTSTNVETTEVYKMILPDAPADATGGYINMITKSAFDRQDIQRFSYDVSFITPSSRISDSFSKQEGTWGKGSHYLMRPNLDLNFARRVNDKVGFNLSYKLSERYDDSPRTEYTWLTVTNTLATGSPLSVQDATLAAYSQRNEQKLTHRESFGAKVDYLITDATKLTFSGQWNWYDLTFTQRANTFTFGTSGVNNAPGIDENRTANSGANIAAITSQRRKYGTTIHTNATLSHEFSDTSKAWLTGYWSQADSKYRDNTGGFFSQAQARLNGASNFTVNKVTTSPTNPEVAVAGRTYEQIFDLSNYTLQTGSTANLRPNTAQDTKSGVQGHYKLTFDTSIPVTLQTGAAYDIIGRNIDTRAYSIVGATGHTGSALEAFKSDYQFDYGYNYGTGEVLDLYKIYDAYGAATMAGRPATWTVTRFDETNLAGYVRVDATFLNSLTVAGGVRYEDHELESYRFNALDPKSRPTPVGLDYADLYPSLMVKYQPNRNWVARAGVSKTVGHPDYAEVLPSFTYGDGSASGVFTFPDPDLEPYSVTNYDISVEYYFSKSGVASASVFRKEVEGFISSGALDATTGLAKLNEALGTNYTPSSSEIGISPRYTTWKNGKNSSVEGIELMYNQTLTFLPKPFDGLNVQINWSKMDVDADDLVTQYAQELAANLQTFNFSIGYRYGKFSTNISTNWTDDKLIGTNVSSNTLNSYQAPDWKTSIGVRYEISKRYQVYVNIANLFSQREEYVRGSALANQGVMMISRDFEFGYPHISLGVKGTF